MSSCEIYKQIKRKKPLSKSYSLGEKKKKKALFFLDKFKWSGFFKISEEGRKIFRNLNYYEILTNNIEIPNYLKERINKNTGVYVKLVKFSNKRTRIINLFRFIK